MTRLILETSLGEVSANYEGSIYIDIGFEGRHASEVINIYDYGNQRRTIENTPEDIERKVVEWLQELEPDIEIYSTKIVY